MTRRAAWSPFPRIQALHLKGLTESGSGLLNQQAEGFDSPSPCPCPQHPLTMQHQELTQEILSRVDQLASTVGTTAAELYTVLTQRGLAIGIADLVVALLCFIIFIITARGVYKTHKDAVKNNNGVYKDEHATVVIPGAFILLIVGIGVFTSLPTALINILSPQAYAAEELLSILK